MIHPDAMFWILRLVSFFPQEVFLSLQSALSCAAFFYSPSVELPYHLIIMVVSGVILVLKEWEEEMTNKGILQVFSLLAAVAFFIVERMAKRTESRSEYRSNGYSNLNLPFRILRTVNSRDWSTDVFRDSGRHRVSLRTYYLFGMLSPHVHALSYCKLQDCYEINYGVS